MALTDMVIMNGADYQAACDAIRAKTGKTDLIKSGDMAAEIESIKSGNKLNDFLKGSIAEISEEDTKGLTTIKAYRFAYVEGIEKAVFKELTAIPQNGFYYTKTVAPDGILDFHAITSIAARGFMNGYFHRLIIRTPTVCTLSNVSGFTLSGSGHYLYVPRELVENYKNATNWSSVIGDPNKITEVYAIEDYPDICGG